MLQRKFKMNDLGPASNILGLNIKRDGHTGNLKLSQKRHASDLLKKFGMLDCKTVTTCPIYDRIQYKNIKARYSDK